MICNSAIILQFAHTAFTTVALSQPIVLETCNFGIDTQESFQEFSTMIENGSKLFYKVTFKKEGRLRKLYLPPNFSPHALPYSHHMVMSETCLN